MEEYTHKMESEAILKFVRDTYLSVIQSYRLPLHRDIYSLDCLKIKTWVNIVMDETNVHFDKAYITCFGNYPRFWVERKNNFYEFNKYFRDAVTMLKNEQIFDLEVASDQLLTLMALLRGQQILFPNEKENIQEMAHDFAQCFVTEMKCYHKKQKEQEKNKKKIEYVIVTTLIVSFCGWYYYKYQ